MARFLENVTDGFQSLEGGMNSGISPSLIQPNQVSFACNTTFRGGFAQPRPAFMEWTLDWQSDSDAEAWFLAHPISGQTVFQLFTGISLICVCAGGRFFSIMRTGDYAGIVTEFTPPDQRNSQYQPITWFCQAANFLVAQNGLDVPVIFDGSTGRRSNLLANEVPVGQMMAYINDRLFLVDPTGRQIFPGDLAYSTPTSAISFTEIFQPASQGGQPLSVPLELGGITGLAVTAQMNTLAGQGCLLVTTDRAVASINPIVQRNLWPTIQLQNIAVVGNGFSSNGMAIVNGDVWGRSLDGYRSYIMAERNFVNYGQVPSWGNTNQSREIARILQYDDLSKLQFSSMVLFDNRLLMTVNPQTINNGEGCYHNGIVALNFDNISNLTQKSAPAYDGLWTGIRPYGFCQGLFNKTQRCFAFSYFPDTQVNGLFEITTVTGDDDGKVPIDWFLETRSFNFQTPYNLKEIDSTELYLDQVSGNVNFNLKYKPSQYPCWIPYKTWTDCAGKTDCDAIGSFNGVCKQPVFTELQYRPRIVLGKPPFACDPIANTSLSQSYEFQLRIEVTGLARIRTGLMFCAPRTENTKLTC